MNSTAAAVIGVILGVGATVAIVATVRKAKINVTILNPLSPPSDNSFQSGVIQLTNVSITHVNSNASPALYHATLTYSDGTVNTNAVLFITDIENLVQIGVVVSNNIDNPGDIPSSDLPVFAAAGIPTSS